MGMIVHHAVVITGSKKVLDKVLEKVSSLSLDAYTTGVIRGTNGYDSFMVAPSGSAQGYDQYEEHVNSIDKLLGWIEKESLSLRYVYTTYGETRHCRMYPGIFTSHFD